MPRRYRAAGSLRSCRCAWGSRSRSTTINYTVTAIVWLAVFVVWLVLDLPDVHVLQLTIVSIAIAVLVPLAFWPYSKTLWAVVDYLVTESEGADVDGDLRSIDDGR